MRNKNIIFTLLAMIITNSALIADPNSSNWAWAHRLGTSVKPLLGNILRKTAEYGAESYHCVLENPIKSTVVALLSTAGLWGTYRWGHKSGRDVGYEEGHSEKQQQKSTLKQHIVNIRSAKLGPYIQRPQMYQSKEKNDIYWQGHADAREIHAAYWETNLANQKTSESEIPLQDINDNLETGHTLVENDFAPKYPYNRENTGHNTVQLGRIFGKVYVNLSNNIDNLNATSLKDKTDVLKERMRENIGALSNYYLGEGIRLGFALAAYSEEYARPDSWKIEKLENITTPANPETAKKERINNYIRTLLDQQKFSFQYTCEHPNATLDEITKSYNEPRLIQFTEQLHDHPE